MCVCTACQAWRLSRWTPPSSRQYDEIKRCATLGVGLSALMPRVGGVVLCGLSSSPYSSYWAFGGYDDSINPYTREDMLISKPDASTPWKLITSSMYSTCTGMKAFCSGVQLIDLLRVLTFRFLLLAVPLCAGRPPPGTNKYRRLSERTRATAPETLVLAVQQV